MLKAALYLAGDRRYAADLKNLDASPVTKQRTTAGASTRIAAAAAFSCRRSTIVRRRRGRRAAREPRCRDAHRREDSYYYNTQELVWGITGLGKWVQGRASKGTAAGTLSPTASRSSRAR